MIVKMRKIMMSFSGLMTNIVMIMTMTKSITVFQT